MTLSKILRSALVAVVMAAPIAAAAPGDMPAPAPASTAARPAQVASADPKITFERYRLPNGLEVILVPDKTVPLVAVSVWYHVGSGNEAYGKSGFAHLFEHMLFQGSQHVGVDNHFDVLKQIGASEINGTTNPDRTNYFEVVPSHQLETALWLESDRMGFLLTPPASVEDPANHFARSLANQIDVVRNERRQRYDNVPYGKTRFVVAAGLYPEGHPYRYLTIGKHEDLTSASVEDVKGFFKTWYVPANATLAIAGDFDVAEIKRLVDKWFGKFPTSTKPKAVAVPAPTVKAQKHTVQDDFAKLRQLQFTWLSPANFADGDAELDVVADALSREGTGRLYKALVYTGLAQSVGAYQGGSQFSGQFSITVTLKSDSDAAAVETIVMDEVARVTREPLADKELARVVANNEASIIRRLETPFGRAETLQAYNHYLGDPDKVTWDLDRYRTTNPTKIRAAASKYLTPGSVVLVTTVPSNAGAK